MDPTNPVRPAETNPVDPDAEAPASRVGPRDRDGPAETLPGTDAMTSETGGLAGTSR